MSKWRSIKTMPDNTLVLLGIWVNHLNFKNPVPEFYLASYDPLDNQLYDQAYEASLPFEKDDFDFWMPIQRIPQINK